MSELRVSDTTLSNVGAELVNAGRTMIADAVPLPGAEIPSLSGIAGETGDFVSGLESGRCALADAAKTASLAVASVMRESDELDRAIENRLPAGYVFEGRAR